MGEKEYSRREILKIGLASAAVGTLNLTGFSRLVFADTPSEWMGMTYKERKAVLERIEQIQGYKFYNGSKNNSEKIKKANQRLEEKFKGLPYFVDGIKENINIAYRNEKREKILVEYTSFKNEEAANKITSFLSLKENYKIVAPGQLINFFKGDEVLTIGAENEELLNNTIIPLYKDKLNQKSIDYVSINLDYLKELEPEIIEIDREKNIIKFDAMLNRIATERRNLAVEFFQETNIPQERKITKTNNENWHEFE